MVTVAGYVTISAILDVAAYVSKPVPDVLSFT